ncbi:hypothetical protein HPB50_012077 [Hyalomma asiaticum]|uniref:Uncharacterized protein n=1 Tax=Hyalomma asiaticum TaxID=266040 RepID=A0ACB7RZQ3_HYAAI|nr:hypothetical protein HPB50_012077 [Hyalomma asiaticum]
MDANESVNELTGAPSNSASQSVNRTASISEDKAAQRRARDAERKRRRRAEDPDSVRKREAASRRQRREADPALREREAGAVRERREADPDLREREAACKRRRRQAAPDAARERERAAKAASRAKQHAQSDARFKRDFLDELAKLSASSTDVLKRNVVQKYEALHPHNPPRGVKCNDYMKTMNWLPFCQNQCTRPCSEVQRLHEDDELATFLPEPMHPTV